MATASSAHRDNPVEPVRPSAPGEASGGEPAFPLAAGLLLGIGLGGFFDGIVLHQLLQWHHMLTSAGYPADSLRRLQLNTVADGLFHTLTYACVLAGVLLLWRRGHGRHARWPTRRLVASLLGGFGAFNLVEGLVNHQLLGLHHVNETVPPAQWWLWDLGFLVWGALMALGGWYLWRTTGRPRLEGTGS